MPREIFGEVSNPSVKLGSQAWYTVPLSVAAHVLLFTIVIIVPLMAADVLPSPPGVMHVIMPAALPEAPPPPPPAVATVRAAPAAVPGPERTAPAPSAAPTGITEPTPEAPGVDIGVPGGIPGGLPGAVTLSPVPAPAPAPAPPAQPLRAGGHIKVPTKIHHVAPVYPAIAQSARVEGTVVIEATIGADGRVKDARVLSSKPLLDQAAVDAVMKWRFTPTLLNGVPVPILMTVTVTFRLAG